MGKRFTHLSNAERFAIEIKLSEGLSYAAIGRSLRRNRSTIMREARRGRFSALDRYLAEFGRRYYWRKRVEAGLDRRKLDEHMLKPAWTTVLFGLRQDWSPQQLCDRLKDGMLPPHAVPAGVSTLSHETIYRAIFGMPAGQQHARLVKMLRHSKSGRRKPHKRNRRRFTGIQNMTPLVERPDVANLRLEPGHWEGDLIKGAGGRSVVGTLVDRFTRMTLLVKLSSANAQEVRRAFQARLMTLPAHMRLSLTYDRGNEMACHEQFTKNTGMPVFFCQAYSPWQRGTNENTNGLLRQYMPKGTDLSVFSRSDLTFIERRLNNRPRRVLWRKTPQETYEIELLKYQQQQRQSTAQANV
jgi:transposase, IS30 family